MSDEPRGKFNWTLDSDGDTALDNHLPAGAILDSGGHIVGWSPYNSGQLQDVQLTDAERVDLAIGTSLANAEQERAERGKG